MTISTKVYTNGEVFTADDLNAHLTILVDEINRLAALHIVNQKTKNLVINGDFDEWQRAVSQTSSGYGSDDRFNNLNTGSTKVHSQQTFTLGQTDVPDNPTFYSRTVATSVGGAGNRVRKDHATEGVAKTAGKTVTLSFWAKADAAKNIAVEFIQNFGSGGSPSSSVLSIGVTTKALTTGWVKQTVTVTLPSISGKTLGTDGNDNFQFVIWMDAGTNFDARTNTLGQQSGTFDISHVQLEINPDATDFEFVSRADNLAECQRFYLDLLGGNYSGNKPVLNTNVWTTSQTFGVVTHPVGMRSSPALIVNDITDFKTFIAGTDTVTTNVALVTSTPRSSEIKFDVAGGLTAGHSGWIRSFSSAARIALDAEL